MDELKMNLSTKWLKDIVTKLISKVVSEKLGYKVCVELSEVHITTTENNELRLHLNGSAVMDMAELAKLAKAASLD